LGVISGGILTDRVGGYNKKEIHVLSLKIGVFAVLFAAPIAYFKNRYYLYICMWFLLFFGYKFNNKRGSLMPS